MTATAQALPATMSVEAAAELLGVSRRHAYYCVKRGDLPSFKLGASIRIPTAAVLEMLRLSEPDHEAAAP
jgi:excisionase family DNA binding protein